MDFSFGQVKLIQLSIFQQNAIKQVPEYFTMEDEFTILGNIYIKSKKIILAYNVHHWGGSAYNILPDGFCFLAVMLFCLEITEGLIFVH
ncbi:MAG: hypothetical protein Ta2G_08990 [Termitinemataceae bacterium]|nr:MAG: hypothetical protein Ta2G_08990 [Termitinemataceae bacterium]